MKDKGKFKVAGFANEWDSVHAYDYEINGSLVRIWKESDEQYSASNWDLSTFQFYVDGGAWVILEESVKQQFQIGDTVVANPNNVRVIEDRLDGNDEGEWTPQYQDWLNGKHAIITSVSYGDKFYDGQDSYTLSVVGNEYPFYIQDTDEMIPYIEQPIEVNREDFYVELKQAFLKEMNEDDKLAEEFMKDSDRLTQEKYRMPEFTKADMVHAPKHYAVFEEVEAIQVIANSMTQDQFYGYCLGNILKYRLRAGGKDDVMQELAKADKYQELYTQYKGLCKGEDN